MVFLDFETRSEAKLDEVGAWHYAMHPSTKILCMAIKKNSEYVKLWDTCAELPAFNTYHAHNAEFEYAIWYFQLHRKLGWKMPHISKWRCTMAQAAACALPMSLDGASKALGLSAKKDPEGARLIRELCIPQYENGIAYFNDDPDKIAELERYCVQDVVVEYELHNSLPELPATEQKLWEATVYMNARGIKVDLDLARAAIHIGGGHIATATNELNCITNGSVTAATQVGSIKKWLDSKNINAKSLGKQAVDTMLKHDMSPDVRRVLELRKALAKTSVAKYKVALDMACKDQRIRGLLAYFAAGTGRWGGRLLQPQNFPRGSIKNTEPVIEAIKNLDTVLLDAVYPDTLELLSSCLRGLLISENGKVFEVADYSSIEARVLMWEADDQIALFKYKQKVDIYVDMAKLIYGKDQINKDERMLGKQAVLGCGYGMGAKRFMETCAAAKVIISEELAAKAVRAYRTKYKSVLDLWAKTENAAISAIKNPGKMFSAGKVKYIMGGQFLNAILPSGRKLYYFKPTIKVIEGPYGDKEEIHYMSPKGPKLLQSKTYGGKLVENNTQAIARDIMASAMLKCNQAGHPIVLTVHDELVAEVPTDKANLSELIRIMCDVPEWAEGCPIDAEGWIGTRYRK